MNPWREQLPDYLLGLLDDPAKAQLEQALQSSAELRSELEELQAVLLRLPEALSPTAPPPRTWAKIKNRINQPKPQPWVRWAAAAAVLALLWLGGLAYTQYQAGLAAQLERNEIAHWLSLPGAEVKALKNQQSEAFGSVIVLPDDRCLFVLKGRPQRGKVYQAWERRSGAAPKSLGVFEGRIFASQYTEGAESIGVSLEPPGGSPQPTQPLGRAVLSAQPARFSPVAQRPLLMIEQLRQHEACQAVVLR